MEKTNMLNTNYIKANYAVVADIHETLNIFPSEKKKGASSFGDIILENVGIKILENVEIEIADNGLLKLKGDQIRDYYNSPLFGEPLSYDELKEKGKFILDENKTYRNTFMGISVSKVMYKEAWIEYKEREPYMVITSNYRITGV